MDDFVGDFERHQGEEVEEFAPRKDALLMAGVPLRRKQSGAYPAQVGEAWDEGNEEVHVLEAKEASHDEWEAEYQEAVAMMAIAKQRRAEVDQARQFFRKPQSSEDREAQLDKLKQKRPSTQCGQLGHWKDDNDCPAKVKAVDWGKPKSFQFPPSRATSLSREREQGATTSPLRGGALREALMKAYGTRIAPAS